MIIKDITYGAKEEVEELHIPLLHMVELQSQSLNVIKGLLEGTDSDEWLKQAENNIK